MAKNILQQAAQDYEANLGSSYPFCPLNGLNIATDIIALDMYAKSTDFSVTVKKIATEALAEIEELVLLFEIEEPVKKALIDIQSLPNVDANDAVEIAKPERNEVVNITAAMEDNAMKAALSGLDDAIPMTAEEKVTGAWVWMEVIAHTSETVDTEDAKRIDKALNGATVGAYLDINLFKQVPGGEKTNVTETDKPVTITIQVPEALRSKNRMYAIIYTHNGGDAKVITPLSYNVETGELVFKASEFSTYALTYTETTGSAPTEPAPTEPAPTEPAPEKPATNPQTGDSANLRLFVAMLLLSACGLVALLIVSKKSMTGKYSR